MLNGKYALITAYYLLSRQSWVIPQAVTSEWRRVMACCATIDSVVSLPKVGTGRAFIRQLIFVGVPSGEVPGHWDVQLLLIHQGTAEFKTARNQCIGNVARQNRVGELRESRISSTVGLIPSGELEGSGKHLELVSERARKGIWIDYVDVRLDSGDRSGRSGYSGDQGQPDHYCETVHRLHG